VAGGYVGERVPRRNDAPLLAGRATFVDDLHLPGMLHAAMLRSPVAHATLTRIDSGALPPGTVALVPDDFAGLGEVPIVWILGEQWQRHTPVCDTRLRYVGQPFAIVLADSRASAEDLVELIEFDLDEHDAVVEIDDALRDGAPLLYPDAGTNIMTRFDAGSSAADTDAAFARASRTVAGRVVTPRLSGAPIECRGIVVAPGADRLTVWSSNQAPHVIRDTICDVFGLRQHAVRVLAPAVGGAFGLKDHLYEDELMVVAAALRTGRPVKWIEDRTEALLATTHARDEELDFEVAFDDDGTLRAIRVDARRNTGAQLAIFGGGPLFAMAGTLPGPYRWDAVRTVGTVVATNRTPSGAYRGFGQTQAALVRERAIDMVAAELDRDPLELRLQNVVRADEMPYTTATMLTYDSGDYYAALSTLRDMVETWPAPDHDGRRRGTGYAIYVQMSGIANSTTNEIIGLTIGGYETAVVTVEPDGSVRVRSGVSPHGQGLETTLAQIAADRLGVDLDSIEITCNDTDATPYSAYGTAASRSMTVGGGALELAAQDVAAKIARIAADMLEAAPEDVRLADGRAVVAGTDIGVPIAAVARRAFQGFRLPTGDTPGLTATVAYDPPQTVFSYAAHACRVAVDGETGAVEVEQYAVVHDCGTVVNPTIVEGQIHGGVAQGLGSALLESIHHSADGQPLTTTFLDYVLPASGNVPDIDIVHIETPSPITPGGMKGMGEGGTNGAMACVYNAVCAALPEAAHRLERLPMTAPRVWEALHA
jgi:aerobic carbon-monoxide dehydrogenase large subunit